MVCSPDQSSTRKTSNKQPTQWPSIPDQVLSRSRFCTFYRQGQWLNIGEMRGAKGVRYQYRYPNKKLTPIMPRQVRGFSWAMSEIDCNNERIQVTLGIMRGLSPDPCSAVSPSECWLLPLPSPHRHLLLGLATTNPPREHLSLPGRPPIRSSLEVAQ